MTGARGPLVVVADDDLAQVKLILLHLKDWGYRGRGVLSHRELQQALADERPAVVILDLVFGEVDGLRVLEELRQNCPAVSVVMLTAHGSPENAFAASKLGAADYLTKPPDMTRLRLILRQVTEAQEANRRLITKPLAPLTRPLLGDSAATRQVRDLITKIAPTEASVLVLGESGTGKELVARAIHEQSRRATGPFVPVNMAALSRELAESELFGHEKGAFTGAERAREGFCEHADRGTLFLDEIGEMDIHLQPKLLRFLEERHFQRVGSTKPITVDVRFVAATNRDPLEHIRMGLLREDLYYRLRGIEIRLPPLRERREDIPVLARQFLKDAVIKNHLEHRVFTPGAIDVLTQFDWPGNVRELLRVTEQLAILSPGEVIDKNDIWQQFGGERISSMRPAILPKESQERAMIVNALAITQGNVKEAALQLGIGYATVYRKIKKYRITNEEWRAAAEESGPPDFDVPTNGSAPDRAAP